MALAAADTIPLRQQQQEPETIPDKAGESAEEPIIDLGFAGPAAPVTYRRTKGRDSLRRLSDIMSAYIPVMSGPSRQQQAQEPLLESEELAPDSPGGGKPGGRGGYRTLMLLNVTSLRADEEFNSSSRENLLDAGDNDEERNRPLVDGDIVGVAMSESGFAFLIFKDSPDILRLDTRSKSSGSNLPGAKACKVLQIRLRGGAKLHATDLKVYKERLFACGRLTRKTEEQSVSLSAMVRCDLDGVVELASKELPEPRFLGFDIDPTDDQLVVASPMPDGHGSQIFKMSADFKEKKFKIQLGTRGDSWHKPEFVACAGGEQPTCWVAVQQSTSPNGLATGQVMHRLLSFPLRCPAGETDGSSAAAPASTKDWMKMSSWKFEGLQPGRLLALQSPAIAPSNNCGRLLMLSRDHGNIHCVSEETGCFPLTHPSSGGGQAFTAFCGLNERPADGSPTGNIDILAATKDSLYLLQST